MGKQSYWGRHEKGDSTGNLQDERGQECRYGTNQEEKGEGIEKPEKEKETERDFCFNPPSAAVYSTCFQTGPEKEGASFPLPTGVI